MIQTSGSSPFSNLLCLKDLSVLTNKGAETKSNFLLSSSQANAEFPSVQSQLKNHFMMMITKLYHY
jgi:hypothetical protein